MILKAAAHPPTDDKLQTAGQKAEKQMAYYLERAFGNDPLVLVFHDLRIEHGGFACQMDHLILHSWGWIIIESKSVVSEVQINAHGEWSRKWNGRFQGMASPVRQAERQQELFDAFMDEEIPKRMSRRLGLLGPIRAREFQSEVLVAISDQGLISGNNRPAGVLKADAVVEEVKNRIHRSQKAARALFSNRQEFGSTHLTAFGQLLVSSHKPSPLTRFLIPQTDKKAAPARSQQTAQSESKHCRVCRSERLEMLWGKYGYYFHCLDCEQNTPISDVFPAFKNGYKIRKQGREFFLEHAGKGTSVLFHVNP
ncbi:nuclease-related domain-containing protein [Deinococcus cellulosilyticus]|uniref:NERD domain-containing protein n=1 Tax=Deinococcus cellulosilyticus (strain DSM 18568 / NBRC 106333 / KACC 11606 / 5516J-15) TaxID=1223518 RepID=A0A511N3G2_DEIC1|nr:nuclease-related domain-containing protein [Deinococcus cellulosilyticus]GEM46956.1 hypothetical protein DC3_25910 [Deinococcus cellulosilyticus NBRC 106333 = KACC 11606]